MSPSLSGHFIREDGDCVPGVSFDVEEVQVVKGYCAKGFVVLSVVATAMDDEIVFEDASAVIETG